MNTLMTLTDWLYSLNRWQMTGVSVTAILFFWIACAGLTALFLRGGYSGDRLKSDDETNATNGTDNKQDTK